MNRIIIVTIAIILAIHATAQNAIYEKEDSIFIERIIRDMSARNCRNKGDRLLDIAERFLGCNYVSGTLENGEKEPLYISCSKLDCTTFVELVLAIGVTMDRKENTFADVCRNLEKIRYRNGVRNGYASRLHYISWWISDSIKQEYIEEVTHCNISRKYVLNLSFMSKNPQNYEMLKEAPELRKEIETYEIPFRNIKTDYIPKEFLNRSKDELPIENGDIIALTTAIEGLDVTHMGFAFWQDGKLHLLHASSGKGKVIRDSDELYIYQQKRKSQTGIRVFRVK